MTLTAVDWRLGLPSNVLLPIQTDVLPVSKWMTHCNGSRQSLTKNWSCVVMFCLLSRLMKHWWERAVSHWHLRSSGDVLLPVQTGNTDSWGHSLIDSWGCLVVSCLLFRLIHNALTAVDTHSLTFGVAWRCSACWSVAQTDDTSTAGIVCRCSGTNGNMLENWGFIVHLLLSLFGPWGLSLPLPFSFRSCWNKETKREIMIRGLTFKQTKKTNYALLTRIQGQNKSVCCLP